MNRTRYTDPTVLRDHAQELRREALAGMASEAGIKWRSLMDLLTEKASAAPTSHATHPCQVASPTHS